MKNLQTNHLLALSLLINEEIYLVKDQVNDTKLQKPSQPKEKANDIVEQTINTQDKPSFRYLGENNKYILILVKEPEAEVLKKEDLNFLLKILSAIKLDLNDVAIVNIEKNQNLNFKALKDFFACNKIITFGINPKILEITTAVANKKSFFEDTPILGTWELSKLQQDVSKKTIFWNELKIF
jgi:hypothetical protein